jgi:hypothetical protein
MHYVLIYTNLINGVWNWKDLPQQWRESIIVPYIRRVIQRTVVITEENNSYHLHIKFYPLLLFSQA